MQQDRLTFTHLKEEYVICICEGAAEQAIIELLLDHNSLVFAHDNLVGREITRKRRKAAISPAPTVQKFSFPASTSKAVILYRATSQISTSCMTPFVSIMNKQESEAKRICFTCYPSH